MKGGVGNDSAFLYAHFNRQSLIMAERFCLIINWIPDQEGMIKGDKPDTYPLKYIDIKNKFIYLPSVAQSQKGKVG